MSFIKQDNALVVANGKQLHLKKMLLPLAALTIYSMIIPVLFIDICQFIYQHIYFTAIGIPKIKRQDYISLERWNLNKLTLLQKINCVYCEYANGVLALVKAVGNQTEVYSCAIKHRHALKDHEYELEFYPESNFTK